MATKNASSKKRAATNSKPRKAAAKSANTSAKKAAAKTKTASAKKASTKSANGSIQAVKGQDEYFYKGFPRYAAYQLLLKAPKQTMTVANFIAKVEKLKNVETKAQANGILQKLVDKKRHVGATCARLVS